MKHRPIPKAQPVKGLPMNPPSPTPWNLAPGNYRWFWALPDGTVRRGWFTVEVRQ